MQKLEPSSLSHDEEVALRWWIIENFIKRKTVNTRYTSYGLKHVFERSENGFYITNDEFKRAMLDCGFLPGDETALNWQFRIAQRSPAVKAMHSGRWL